jgi:hypothetical protein
MLDAAKARRVAEAAKAAKDVKRRARAARARMWAAKVTMYEAAKAKAVKVAKRKAKVAERKAKAAERKAMAAVNAPAVGASPVVGALPAVLEPAAAEVVGASPAAVLGALLDACFDPAVDAEVVYLPWARTEADAHAIWAEQPYEAIVARINARRLATLENVRVLIGLLDGE